ncbi:hypothetical protein PVBG_06054 [Plasmodium vivax Brazil I]|uniref:Variable surface protein Vir35 n=1 Tax=Plasmodium vivax (strain Brazil I) TaxID=1033975 RepID=A0A0J9SJT1_PLAV1|nr:hypothetical protein PVBG_06054 [Plasmodium vivax Brazil I]
MNKPQLTFLFNIVSLTFLTWISNSGNELGNLNKYIITKDNIGNTWKVRNDRLLTNNDSKSEIGQSGLKKNLKEPKAKNKLKDIRGPSEIPEKIKKNTSNSMYTYIKKLEHEYPNKKGLKRLDCHYEKKLFGEIYELDKIAGNMKSKNSYFKKVILKRYSLRFFIFSLVILFGIVESIVFKYCDYIKESDGNIKLQNILLGTNGIVFIPFIIYFIYVE